MSVYHREAQHQGSEKRDFDLDEKSFENVGVDEPPLTRAKQRLDKHRENVGREVEADEKEDGDGRQRP